MPDATIRVRDAEGKLVVHWQLDGVNPLGTGNVSLNLNDLLAGPIALQGNVIDSNAVGVAASVTIQSESLTGNATQASFHQVTDTDAQGVFNVNLVAGTYDVFVSPKTDTTLASAQGTWNVSSSTLGHGTSFTLQPRPSARGQVTTMTGAAFASVPVVVTPHSSDAMSYFDKVNSSAMALTRDGNQTTDGGGNFSFLVDPGTVDFSVRPPSTSRFSWLVQPQIAIDPDTGHDFKTIAMPAPAIVVGNVSTADGVVPSAVVRAYVVDKSKTMSNPNATPSVVQIGETVTDSAGHFELPLPPSLVQTQ
jgi:hypothetical protein